VSKPETVRHMNVLAYFFLLWSASKTYVFGFVVIIWIWSML